MGFFEKLKAGLKKTKDSMMSKIERLLVYQDRRGTF